MRLPGIGKAASSDIGHQKKSAPYVPRCLLAASLLALVSAALVGLPATGAAAQSPPTAQPASADIAAEGIAADLAGEDAEDGLAPADALGGPPLGEAIDEVGLLDVLGPDGTYTLRDGDGEVRLRLLDPVDVDSSELAGLAAAAATAYTSDANDTASSGVTAPSNWLVSDSGQMFLMVGGVNVLFERRLSQPEISAVLAEHGVDPVHVSALGELPNAYLIKTVSDAASLRLADALSGEPGVVSAAPNLYTPLSAGPAPKSLPYTAATQRTHNRCTPYTEPYPDQLSACLWHLDADTDYRFSGADPTIDINLGDVWATTMGAGVTVAVVDHTWEATHEDIRDNVDTARSQILGGFTGENERASTPYHGTAVAGIVAARDNTVGGRGVAPRATLVNYNLLDNGSSAAEVTAMTLNKETVAVYNLSYGDTDSYSPTTSSHLWRQAVAEGLYTGFGGKGSSYVKAAGNGALLPGSDWASLEESNNHPGIIPVCALGADGASASYSERGASLWVCAPGGGIHSEPRILAPIGQNGYTDTFNGTSASAPIVSGVIALMRSVNADLTWRDVKVILANTAQKNHASDSSWTTGAAKYGSDAEKYSFSYKYGFGAVDAKAAVEAASSWTLLPTGYIFQREIYEYAALPDSGKEIELRSDFASALRAFASRMDFTEHVEVTVRGEIYDMRDYRWTLVSPSGTESLLAPEYTSCEAGTCGLRGIFRFGSSRHLGENPSGTWKLKVRRYAPDVAGCNGGGNGTGTVQSSRCQRISSFSETITSWKISVAGHTSSTAQPVKLSVSPSTVTEGGEVDVSVTVGGTAPAKDLVVPLKITDGTTTAAGSPGADYAALASITVAAGASSASAKLATAQAAVITARVNLTDLQAKPTSDDIRDAEIALEQARLTHDDTVRTSSNASAETKERAGVVYHQAQLDYQEALEPATPEELAEAQANLSAAEANLAVAQAARDDLAAGPDLVELNEAITTAQRHEATATAELEDLLAGADGGGPTDAMAGRGDNCPNPHALLQRKKLIPLGSDASVGYCQIHGPDAGPAQIFQQPLGRSVGPERYHHSLVVSPHLDPGVEHGVERRVGCPQGHRRHQQRGGQRDDGHRPQQTASDQPPDHRPKSHRNQMWSPQFPETG